MKKKILIAIGIIVIANMILLCISTGFVKCTNVYLTDYELAKDEMVMTIKVDVASSAGYIRDCTVKTDGENEYITFYSTFGGLNSNIGAKNEFEVALGPSCNKIYFDQGENGLALVLQRNQETNEWERVK